MSKGLFLAGASGAVGRRLAPLLVSEGWRVVGTTRSADIGSAQPGRRTGGRRNSEADPQVTGRIDCYGGIPAVRNAAVDVGNPINDITSRMAAQSAGIVN